MSELSPAAQAVLDAFLGDDQNTGLQMDDLRENVAAALRAAADQLAYGHTGRPIIDEKALLAIADELDAQ
jgi:hypothetical protein